MKTIFSGVQPTGVIHIGNYLGAIKRWTELQASAERSIFCVVDLHALTVKQEKESYADAIYSVAAMYLAAGIDPSKPNIFIQSEIMEHAALCWLLNCISKMGELNRMTQFKDKSGENREGVSVGLYDYPVLMASDILLYQATEVPVGEDQKQHLELTRDLAIRFNSEYCKVFTVPEPVIFKSASRIMGLDNPMNKMSKSASSPNNYIAITDEDNVIAKKIAGAVTDSGSEV